LTPIRPEPLELVELAAVFGFEVLGLKALGFIVLWLMALGFDALGLGLPGVVAVLPGDVLTAPPVAPLAPPADPPPALPPLCARARPVLPRKATVASKANRCLVRGISDSLCAPPTAKPTSCQDESSWKMLPRTNVRCTTFNTDCALPLFAIDLANTRRREIFRRRIY
jgi:hypothetical protein